MHPRFGTFDAIRMQSGSGAAGVVHWTSISVTHFFQEMSTQEHIYLVDVQAPPTLMSSDVGDEASCHMEHLPVCGRGATAPAECPDLSATELARELSNAVLQFRSQGQDLSTLVRLVRKAAAHVRDHGLRTVGHIVLSGTLTRICREVPSIVSILKEEGWVWFQSQR
jgi:hypothetical protein